MEIDFSSYFSLSSLATFHLLAIAGTGALCTKIKVFRPQDVEGITSIINVCLLPMLVFTQMLKGFDITDLSQWLPVVAIILIQVSIGVVLGYAISYATWSKANALKFLITSLSFTQTKTLQLLLVDNFAEAMEQITLMSGREFTIPARDRALNYVLLSYLIENMLRYSLGALLLTPDEDEIEDEKMQRYTELTGDEYSYSREVDTAPKNRQNIFNYNGVFNVSFLAFVLAVALSFFHWLRHILLDEQNIVHETIFVSSVLISKTVKVMTIFVFGAALP